MIKKQYHKEDPDKSADITGMHIHHTHCPLGLPIDPIQQEESSARFEDKHNTIKTDVKIQTDHIESN